MTAPYSAQLKTPQPCDHLIQLYTDEAFLARVVGEYLSAGLLAGEAAIVIAVPSHRTLFREQLTAAGVNVVVAETSGQLVMLDAEECLSRFMVDGMPDGERFFGLVKPVLEALTKRGLPRTRLYGEMVDLLWNHSMPATVALEELWNQVLVETKVSLLCAYRIDNFDRRVHRGVLHQITACHSELIPVENYERLDRAVTRAYEETFGAVGDAEQLRSHIAAEYRGRTRMPAPQAALLGLRDVAPSVVDSILARARYHYER